jgi:hypothetical protein
MICSWRYEMKDTVSARFQTALGFEDLPASI